MRSDLKNFDIVFKEAGSISHIKPEKSVSLERSAMWAHGVRPFINAEGQEVLEVAFTYGANNDIALILDGTEDI
jgi:hypothetical protein